VVIAGHSALKTRVNALTTRQSIFFAEILAKMMDHPKSGKPADDAGGTILDGLIFSFGVIAVWKISI